MSNQPKDLAGELPAEWETIGPALAEKYLGMLGKQRSVRRGVVTKYAGDLRAGRWAMTGETLSFDTDGKLINGQHRLNAIIQSGESMRILVIRGVNPEAMKVIDTGAARSTADYLGLEGIPNRMVLPSIARMVILFEAGRLLHKVAMSNAEVIDWIAEHYEEVARAGERAIHYNSSIPASRSVTGAAYILFRRVDVSACTEFFEDMSNMSLKDSSDPRLVLMRRLRAIEIARDKYSRNSQAYMFDMMLAAWNAWRTGTDIDIVPNARFNVVRAITTETVASLALKREISLFDEGL